jgi:hypothetical protein
MLHDGSLQVQLLIIHAQLISDNVLLWEDDLTRGVFMSRFKVHLHLLYCPLNAFQLHYKIVVASGNVIKILVNPLVLT